MEPEVFGRGSLDGGPMSSVQEDYARQLFKRYLVRGGGNRDVRCAFETLMAVEALEDGAPIYRVPDDTVEAFGRFLGDYVIGVYGDDWVIAMTWDGDVGYVRRADLWAGNG